MKEVNGVIFENEEFCDLTTAACVARMILRDLDRPVNVGLLQAAQELITAIDSLKEEMHSYNGRVIGG